MDRVRSPRGSVARERRKTASRRLRRPRGVFRARGEPRRDGPEQRRVELPRARVGGGGVGRRVEATERTGDDARPVDGERVGGSRGGRAVRPRPAHSGVPGPGGGDAAAPRRGPGRGARGDAEAARRRGAARGGVARADASRRRGEKGEDAREARGAFGFGQGESRGAEGRREGAEETEGGGQGGAAARAGERRGRAANDQGGGSRADRAGTSYDHETSLEKRARGGSGGGRDGPGTRDAVRFSRNRETKKSPRDDRRQRDAF